MCELPISSSACEELWNERTVSAEILSLSKTRSHPFCQNTFAAAAPILRVVEQTGPVIEPVRATQTEEYLPSGEWV